VTSATFRFDFGLTKSGICERLSVMADVLLYSSLLTGAGSLAILGAATGPLIWVCAPVRVRHVALLLSLLCFTLLAHGQIVDEWGIAFQGYWLPVTVSPSFLLRPTLLPILFTAAASPHRSQLVAATGAIGLTLLALGSYQVLSIWRVDLETAGFLTCAIVAAIEAWNAYWIWRPSDLVASFRLVSVTAVAAVASIAVWVPPSSPRPSRIAIWWPDPSTPEFKTSVEGKGWANIGHFGELPRLLAAGGHRVSTVRSLRSVDADLLILPPPFRTIRPEEIDGVRDFVISGGRLLLIGEHTNLDSVRDTFGQLLAGSGIGLNFDTTNGLFGDTTMTLQGPHVHANPYITHNRGASIAVFALRPTVLLRGTWWHSDVGDSLAPERSFLSDYRLSRGDRLGNLVLAARTRLGQGEILLWGDGSPFLNQNLPFNGRYLLSTIQDVVGQSTFYWLGPAAAIFLCGLFAVDRSQIVAGLVILIALVAPTRANTEAALPASVAIISDGEQNDFSRDPFSDQGITGLSLSLNRLGYMPWLGDWRQATTAPQLLFIVNPVVASATASSRLRALAESGSTVVIAGGGYSDAFQRMVEGFGATVTGPPLGSIVADGFTTYAAWRLDVALGTPLMANETPIGTVIRVGKGRIVLLADSGFFYSKNLETEIVYDAKNQRFLKWLVTGQAQ
jgi:hypothetical protein